MKVCKKAWHYRVLTGTTGFKPSQSLCGYFWQVMFATFFAAPIILTLVGVYVLGAGALWAAQKALQPVGAFLGWAWRLIPKRQPKPQEWRTVPPPKEPGLLRSWIKAKKDRVCPLIEFTDPPSGNRSE